MVVVSYGITSRVARAAIQQARAEGRAVGELRLITLWPFPEQHDPRAGRSGQGLRGSRDQPRARSPWRSSAAPRARPAPLPVPHAGGAVHDPEVIYQAMVEATS